MPFLSNSPGSKPTIESKRNRDGTVRLWMRLVLVAWMAGLAIAPQPTLAGGTKLVSMPAFGDVESFAISPDGAYVVYLADAETDGVLDLYSVPLNGDTPVQLNNPLVTGGEVGSFEISADSNRVVYRADQEANDVWELYSVPIAGPAHAQVKLNPPLPAGGNVLSYQISPDGSRVVYRADQDSVRPFPDVGGVYELYSVPIAGPAVAGVKINHPLRFEVQICMPGEDKYADDVVSFEISPDSSRVIYRAKRYLDCEHVHELFSVPIAGPVDDVVQLSGTMVTGGDLSEYEVSADSSRVVYQADQDTDGVSELYSVPVGGPAGAGVKLNNPLVTGGDVSGFSISGDSSRVVYRADQETNGLYELYSAPISGPAGSGVKLTAPEIFGGTSLHVNNFSLSPDGAWALYHAKLDDAPCWELYSVPAAGPATHGVKLNGPLPTGAYGVVMEIRISADSSRVVYHADQDTALQLDLYSVPIGGPATAAVRLNLPPVAGGAISWWSYQISPDGSRVAYQADQDIDNVTELYSVPIAGPDTAGVKLNAALVDGGDVDAFAFSPVSSRVVYAADQDTDDVVELYVTGTEYTVYLPLVLRSYP